MIDYFTSLSPIEIAGLLFLIVGIFLFLFNLKSIFLANSSKNWKKTQGEIISSELNIIESTGEPGKSFNPSVKYKYNVNGNEYFSTRIYFGNKVASSFKKKKSLRIIGKYPKGKLIEVFYNPMKEKLSVLEPGIKSEPVSLLIVGIIFIIGGYFVLTNTDLVINFFEN